MSKPLLFYSQKDPNSINLWKRLSKDNKLNQFIKICVDNNNKIPKLVTSIPSIYIKGRPLIYGQGIHMYLSSAMQKSMPVSQSKNDQPNFQQAPDNNKRLDAPPKIESSTNELNGISDFNAVEMGGAWSDKYSFVQDNPAPMNYCYQFLDNIKDNQITGHNSGNKTNNNSNNQLDSKLAQLQKDRAQIFSNRR
jgi:hypothetical protein